MSRLVTERDKRIVQLVGQTRVATARQIQIAEFGLEHGARCRARLLGLVQEHWLDVIEAKIANQPNIYRLGRASINGNQYLRMIWGDQKFKSCMTRIWNMPHLLGITELRVRVIRSCKDNMYQLVYWQRAEDLQIIMPNSDLIPDAYFMIQRLADGELKRSHYFLEYELSVKSNEVIRDKLDRYQKLIYSGKFADLFGTDLTPRVLFVFAPFHNIVPKPRLLAALKIAGQLGASFSRFITLDELTAISPSETLTAPIWHSATSATATELLAS
jgi:hypothetical protein